jgi:DNA mismatch endonuclease (patch repair protein)
MDNLKKEDRSKCMSHIRSKWTTQEKRIHNLLKGRRIKHKMHPQIRGSPDLILIKKKTAVFLNGCFWHKCSKCYTPPKSRRAYWIPKLNRNFLRDKRNITLLRKNDWRVISLWEHEINKNIDKVLRRII